MSHKLGQILDAMVLRLQDISVIDGYNTNAGTNVTRGRQAVTEHDPMPRLTVVPGRSSRESDTGTQGRRYQLTTTWSIQGIAVCDPDDPYAAGHPLLDDIMRAALRWDDATLGGLLSGILRVDSAEVLTREESSKFVFVVVELTSTHVEIYGET